MISSSKSVIKEWRPEVVRDFIPFPTVTQPVIREMQPQELSEAVFYKKNENSPDDFSDGLDEAAASLEEDLSEAQQELNEARIQAEALLEAAREEAEKIREEAREEGFARGLEEGRQEGMAQAIEQSQEVLENQKNRIDQELSDALSKIEQAKKRCLQDYLEQLKDCSFAVAEKVIHTSLEASGDIIRRMIVFETEKLKKTAWLKIYMEKLDYDMMMRTDADLVAELSKVSDNIKFIVMEKEQRGSCIIETPEEILDIGVETQMENIREMTGTIRV